jgi:dienelactone hydrolase
MAAAMPPSSSTRFTIGVRTAQGVAVEYALSRPRRTPAGPVPLFLLLHGFAGHHSHMHGHAARLADLGCAVLTPNMSSLTRPSMEAAQERNIRGVAEHVAWALTQLALDGDAGDDGKSARLVDPARVVLAGHSAGGAVVFEAAAELRTRAIAVAAVLLLDGVPWPRTIAVAADFPVHATHLISLRSEPSAWNMHGELRKVLAAAPLAAAAAGEAWAGGGGGGGGAGGRVVDLRIAGSRHADPVDPKRSTCLMRLLGLLGPAACWEAYAQLVAALGEDAVAGRLGGGGAEEGEGVEAGEGEGEAAGGIALPAFWAAVARMAKAGEVVVTPAGR